MSWKVYLKKFSIVAVFLFVAAITVHKYGQEELVDALASKVIRFHVLANSDSEEDQQLKLKVRDAIGAYLHTELADAKNAGESREIIEADMEEITARAREVIREEGYDYEVSAALARSDFPEKTYGEFTFPEGNYEALRVEIGEGAGKNWWCVMYPNMCFQNSMYEVVDEEAEKSLKSVLTTDEYAAIMENGGYEVKFRWLSFLNR